MGGASAQSQQLPWLRICQPQTFIDNLLYTSTELRTPKGVKDEPEHLPEAKDSSWPHILKALKFKQAKPMLHCILGLVLVGQWGVLERTIWLQHEAGIARRD